MRRRQSEFERQLEAQAREAEARLKQELQQREVIFHAKLKQREQELAIAVVHPREIELRSQFAAACRPRRRMGAR